MFLRNHELDLGRLTERQRHQVFAAFAPHPEMQLYERGIRRRLATATSSAWAYAANSTDCLAYAANATARPTARRPEGSISASGWPNAIVKRSKHLRARIVRSSDASGSSREPLNDAMAGAWSKQNLRQVLVVHVTTRSRCNLSV